MSASDTYLPKAIVVDDDDDIRYAISRILRQCGCEVVEASSVDSALLEIETQAADVAFCDLRFRNGQTGDSFLEAAHEIFPDMPVVMMSCSMPREKIHQLMQAGACECLQKPIFKDGFLEILYRLELLTEHQRAA